MEFDPITLNETDAIFRLFFSLLLGAMIGVEREYSQQSAGLRTHILVCLGATAFTLISILMTGVDFGHVVDGHYTINRDPTRIAAQILPGIGFIGGGAVLRHGASVRGLTTAASLWLTASIGMMAGLGSYRLSMVVTLMAFIVLFTIGNIERHIFKKHLKTFNRLRMNLVVVPALQLEVQDWVEKNFEKQIISIKQTVQPDTELASMSFVIEIKKVAVSLTDLNKKVSALSGVVQSNIKIYLEDSGN